MRCSSVLMVSVVCVLTSVPASADTFVLNPAPDCCDFEYTEVECSNFHISEKVCPNGLPCAQDEGENWVCEDEENEEQLIWSTNHNPSAVARVYPPAVLFGQSFTAPTQTLCQLEGDCRCVDMGTAIVCYSTTFTSAQVLNHWQFSNYCVPGGIDW